jgi:formylglycine-generating enzyme required for sulfatase activity
VSELAEAAPPLVPVPAGRFVMGDAWGDGEADERPAVEREVAPFRLGRYAVTNEEFAPFVSAIGRARAADLVDLRAPTAGLRWEGDTVACREGRRRHPVTFVSWRGASAYCAWLRERHGLPYRLPTEVEWQWASVGDRALKWSLGEAFDPRAYVCRCDEPRAVDWGVPSPAGFYNLTGNVFEWSSDEYAFALDGQAPRLSGHRVIKGGAFILNDSANLRNAKRFSCHEESCLGSVGLRVAADGS